MRAVFGGPRFVAAACLALACSAAGAVETWRVAEIPLTASRDYTAGGGDAVVLDVAFSNRATGAVMTLPGFWDGARTFLVRFAPPQVGVWDWRSACARDAGLDGRSGSLEATPYAGKLALYRHGFIETRPGKKFFVHADGTPFLYLGDTHWGMYKEEFDEAGPHAGTIRTTSHFRHIVNRRVEQGFTVYQSEPINAPFDVTDGRVDAADIAGFRQADRYYRHIADAGLVHANAEFFFCSQMSPRLAADPAALNRLSRYWVARFGAFPVIWTLAQEADNDFYADRKQAHNFYSTTNNPWVKVAEFIHAADAYRHPLSAHQENTGQTTVTGAGVKPPRDGRSVFADRAVAARTGHDWWAVQWWAPLTSSVAPTVPADYWRDPRPAVNYEGFYCYLWTKDFGARVHGYRSFLSGFCGYGYGAIDQWLYKSSYNVNVESFDGIDRITRADKAVPWSVSLEFPSARQMIHLRRFLEWIAWWRLEPELDGRGFEPAKGAAFVSARRKDEGLRVFCFYNTNRVTGVVTELPRGSVVRATWYDPRGGTNGVAALSLKAGTEGRVALPPKPDNLDWLLTLETHSQK